MPHGPPAIHALFIVHYIYIVDMVRRHCIRDPSIHLAKQARDYNDPGALLNMSKFQLQSLDLHLLSFKSTSAVFSVAAGLPDTSNQPLASFVSSILETLFLNARRSFNLRHRSSCVFGPRVLPWNVDDAITGFNLEGKGSYLYWRNCPKGIDLLRRD